MSFDRRTFVTGGRQSIGDGCLRVASEIQAQMSEATKDRFPIPIETLLKTLPVRRTGVPEDIANACAWLVAEETGYVTGQTIGVNGGRVMT
jgi:NAD(P)-dependent dehydrogenase (short-subunit alcohol dehydrogenase family)